MDGAIRGSGTSTACTADDVIISARARAGVAPRPRVLLDQLRIPIMSVTSTWSLDGGLGMGIFGCRMSGPRCARAPEHTPGPPLSPSPLSPPTIVKRLDESAATDFSPTGSCSPAKLSPSEKVTTAAASPDAPSPRFPTGTAREARCHR